MSNDIFKLILPAAQIPDRATVTKRTGSKEHVLRRVITVYGEAGEKREITCREGAVFLVNPDTCDANVYGNEVEMVWLVDRDELLAHLGYC